MPSTLLLSLTSSRNRRSITSRPLSDDITMDDVRLAFFVSLFFRFKFNSSSSSCAFIQPHFSNTRVTGSDFGGAVERRRGGCTLTLIVNHEFLFCFCFMFFVFCFFIIISVCLFVCLFACSFVCSFLIFLFSSFSPEFGLFCLFLLLYFFGVAFMNTFVNDDLCIASV